MEWALPPLNMAVVVELVPGAVALKPLTARVFAIVVSVVGMGLAVVMRMDIAAAVAITAAWMNFIFLVWWLFESLDCWRVFVAR